MQMAGLFYQGRAVIDGGADLACEFLRRDHARVRAGAQH